MQSGIDYMKRLHYTTGLCGLLLLLGGTRAMAQNGINSLYSAYGIGDLEQRDYTRNFGVGSTGIARRSEAYLNELNPASYSAIPRQNFMFDVALRGQIATYKDAGNLNQHAGDLTFRRLAMGFKVNNRWGMSLGFSPFSTVDYKLNTKTTVGNQLENTTLEGSGGINKAYITNSVRLTKNFSVGVSTNFLFGPNTVTQNIANDTVSSRLEKYAFSVNFNTGIQYNGKLGKNWVLGLGATYRFSSPLSYRQKEQVINSNQEVLYEDPDMPNQKFTVPTAYSAGIMLGNGTINWLADYRKENWTEKDGQTTNYNFTNSTRYSTGLEYTFRRTYYNQTYEGIVVQAGFSYYSSYITIADQQIKDISGTAGVSLPSKNGSLRYYVGVEVGQRGTIAGNLIRENYVNAVFHFSLRDIWFVRRTYD
jgi:hypothetical protein